MIPIINYKKTIVYKLNVRRVFGFICYLHTILMLKHILECTFEVIYSCFALDKPAKGY